MRSSGLGPSHLFVGLAAFLIAVALFSWAPWSAHASSVPAEAIRTSNVAMACAPGQQAFVHQGAVDGELNVSIECAGAQDAAAYGAGLDRAAAGPAAVPVPAMYRPVAAPVRALAPDPPVGPARASARRKVRARDWKRDALVIGGAAGAGAGIGGLVGGRKGALIGAALGGGGAALYRTANDR